MSDGSVLYGRDPEGPACEVMSSLQSFWGYDEIQI